MTSPRMTPQPHTTRQFAPEAERFVSALGAYLEVSRAPRRPPPPPGLHLTSKFDFETARTAKRGPLGRLLQAVIDRILNKVVVLLLPAFAAQERLNVYLLQRLADLERRTPGPTPPEKPPAESAGQTGR